MLIAPAAFNRSRLRQPAGKKIRFSEKMENVSSDGQLSAILAVVTFDTLHLFSATCISSVHLAEKTAKISSLIKVTVLKTE